MIINVRVLNKNIIKIFICLQKAIIIKELINCFNTYIVLPFFTYLSIMVSFDVKKLTADIDKIYKLLLYSYLLYAFFC